MKVYLTDQDELVIEAESTIEAMALMYWSDDYFKSPKKRKRASLLLKLYKEENHSQVIRQSEDLEINIHTKDE